MIFNETNWACLHFLKKQNKKRQYKSNKAFSNGQKILYPNGDSVKHELLDGEYC